MNDLIKRKNFTSFGIAIALLYYVAVHYHGLFQLFKKIKTSNCHIIPGRILLRFLNKKKSNKLLTKQSDCLGPVHPPAQNK